MEADPVQAAAASSCPGRLSLKSNASMGLPENFRGAEVPASEGVQPAAAAASSCPGRLSLKSDASMGLPENFRGAEVPAGEGCRQSRDSSDQNRLNQNLDQKDFEDKLCEFMKSNVRRCWKVFGPSGEYEDDGEKVLDDELIPSEAAAKEAFLQIALHVLRTMKMDAHVAILEQRFYGELVMYQRKLKSSMRVRYEHVAEGIASQGNATTFNKIYTELYVLDGDMREINSQHEVRQIETAVNRPKSVERPIKCEDIFKPLPKHGTRIRTVLTQGIAGIGKTMLAQKFMLDWAEEKANQDIQLLFSLPFRELNLLRSKRTSLMELLYDFSPDLRESGIKDLNNYRVLFVLDGLDECRLHLDFQGYERCCDATQSASVDVLLMNVIAGDLLPKANLWITTRPAAAGGIPPQFVDRVTEIQGFSDPQKESYFRKKIDDENLAKRVVAHIKSTRSLYIMCHVPVFCWISSIVLGKMFAQVGGGKMPKTLTHMYIHFVAYQTTLMHVKYREEQQLDSQGNNKVIMSLGKLAFQQQEKGNLIFYEEDLTECGIDVKEASVYSGVCTQVFREESWMQHKVFCFVHLSVQEFLAALYVHVMYKVSGINLMIEEPGATAKTKPESELHKAAVDKALQSDNGHLDLFLRFLLGLSLESGQGLLRGLKIKVETCNSQSHTETIKYIKEKIRQTPHTDRCINLFHCLSELNDDSLLEEIQGYMDSDRDSAMDECSAAQWAALVFVLLTSQEQLELFELKRFSRKEEGLQRLLPVLKASRSARLNDCRLTANCCESLSSAVSSASSDLCDLNLSDNSLHDAGVELLCTGLQSPHCRLKTLTLNRCGLTQRSCVGLASVLSSPSSHLQELDLSDNDIEDSGVQLLCAGLRNVSCKLEILRLSFCSVTEKGCVFLASAVKSNPSHLRELDLSYNHLGESGVPLVSEALEEGGCEFTKLRVDHNEECWLKPGLSKYACELTVDLNTAHKLLIISDGNRRVTQGREEQPYPDHPDRFDYWTQVLFQQGLTGRCYWEVEWEGNWAGIGVTYRGIGRKGVANDCVMGYNGVSWGLHCSAHGYAAYHNIKSIAVSVPSSGCHRVAVYLDWEAGVLSFYRVSSGRSLTHLHTFYTTFTEPLHPGFRVWDYGSSVALSPPL
ncbi:NACHT, LRR and PYD domains-containing protein 3 isoform X2 [Scophthalmus maximus]|uniref:NACHT, LRR and PYD domains-containing protein 3 isoform X2 n=1 Tax=Scophthalmus maximus TaxID=52904 RepID=UPI001FA90B44|nr:NACHT, LRR and PYD domains-containing protein 3 isoform X2 [Scophthalmus maximus]XP_047190848.1 NACHT, LRR and PYD domains-containing protein 3 isoform X2 [Scophthalmus maximus]XP_047190849.1 NACHT, LRR and PYD domains-containing protein 3 isoform X2 [Scophthalmus maximus]